MKKPSSSLMCMAGHLGSGPFCLSVSVPLQTSVFLGAMDSSCSQPQGPRGMDRRQNFDFWGPHIAINEVFSYWNSLGNSIWLFKMFWNKKIRTLAGSNWKASICLIHRLHLIFFRTVWQLMITIQTGWCLLGKKMDTWYHQRQDSMKLYTVDKINTEFICRCTHLL